MHFFLYKGFQISNIYYFAQNAGTQFIGLNYVYSCLNFLKKISMLHYKRNLTC